MKYLILIICFIISCKESDNIVNTPADKIDTVVKNEKPYTILKIKVSESCSQVNMKLWLYDLFSVYPLIEELNKYEFNYYVLDHENKYRLCYGYNLGNRTCDIMPDTNMFGIYTYDLDTIKIEVSW